MNSIFYRLILKITQYILPIFCSLLGYICQGATGAWHPRDVSPLKFEDLLVIGTLCFKFPTQALNINTDCMCSHVIFIVFFKFCLENADGDGFIAHTSALEMTQLLNVLIPNNIWYCQNKLSAAVWVINE